MNSRELLGRLREPRGQRAAQGWATHSLESSVRRALLVAMAAWQGVMVLAAVFSLGLETVPTQIVTLCHILVVVGVLIVLRSGRGAGVLIPWIWGVFVVDWAVAPRTESVLLFTACWMCNWNSASVAFFLRARASWMVPLGAAVVVPVLMAFARPEWVSHPLVFGVFVTLIAITAATRIGLSYMLDYTSRVDTEARQMEQTSASLTTRKAATHQAAEDARVLHDTAINTLGAIANGGVAMDDADAVRQRCLADIKAIETLRSSTSDDLSARFGLRDAIRPLGIKLRYTGMSGDELSRTEALLPSRVVRDFSRVIAEAVQNAAKHSGADEVTLSINRTRVGVRVTVRDDGIGIRGEIRRGGGMERSILQRASDAGISVSIDSAPERGTSIILDYTFEQEFDQEGPLDVETGNVEDVVGQLRSRAVFSLSAGLVGIGVTLAALNHPGQPTPEWLMTLVVAVACGLAWRQRRRERLAWWVILSLIVAAPAAFILSAWAVGFGSVNPVLWQAMAPTGPLLALMIFKLPRIWKALGIVSYLVGVVALAVWVSEASLEAAAIVIAAGLVGLGFLLGVVAFVRRLAGVAIRARNEQRARFTASLELAMLDAAADTRRRWRDAGLEESVRLLREIGEGAADPRDPAVRKRCADEESFLRQLSLLSPGLIQMGTWFARALNAARQRGVTLDVRAGGSDAMPDQARVFGRTLLAAVDAVPKGVKLTTTLFATAKGLSMTLVAPAPHLSAALRAHTREVDALNAQTLGTQDFVELAVSGASV